MSDTPLSFEEVLARYNKHFDNTHYSAIAAHLAADLGVHRESLQVSDVMNMLTDACLALCGSQHHQDAVQQLAAFYGQNNISQPAIDMISRYLLIFEQQNHHIANDFDCIAKSLRSAYVAKDSLTTAVACANGIHS